MNESAQEVISQREKREAKRESPSEGRKESQLISQKKIISKMAFLEKISLSPIQQYIRYRKKGKLDEK